MRTIILLIMLILLAATHPPSAAPPVQAKDCEPGCVGDPVHIYPAYLPIVMNRYRSPTYRSPQMSDLVQLNDWTGCDAEDPDEASQCWTHPNGNQVVVWNRYEDGSIHALVYTITKP